MTVFKGYMTIAKKNIKLIIVYFVVFTVIALAMSASKNGKMDSFSSEKLRIAVVDNDKSELSKIITKYLKENHHVQMASYDRSALQERIYYEDVKTVICIKKGFEKDSLSGKGGGMEYIQNPGEYAGMYIESQLNHLVENLVQYYEVGYSVSDSYEKVQNQHMSKVTMEDVNGNGGEEAGYVGFFRFYPYLVLAVLCTVLCMVLVTFRQKNIKMRMNASNVSVFRQNMEAILAFAIIGVIVYIATMLLAFIMHGEALVKASNLAYYLVNGFLVVLISLAMAFLLGLLVKSEKQVSIMITPLTLIFGFICGVFVPLYYLPDVIVRVARFLPIYWFEYVNDILGKHADIAGSLQRQVLKGMGMELLFTVAIIGCAMAMAKYQQQER